MNSNYLPNQLFFFFFRPFKVWIPAMRALIFGNRLVKPGVFRRIKCAVSHLCDSVFRVRQ